MESFLKSNFVKFWTYNILFKGALVDSNITLPPPLQKEKRDSKNSALAYIIYVVTSC